MMIEILTPLSNSNGNLGGGKSNSKKKQSAACLHPAFLNKNLCALCNKSVNKSNIPTTLPFDYLFRDLSITLDAVQRLRDLDLDQLLRRRRLRLVLDLDQTLIHAMDITPNDKNKKKKNNKSPNDVYPILKGHTSVKLRPGVRDFLNKASQLFDLSIYTMAEDDYAKDIAKILETDSVRFSSVVSRDYSPNNKSLDMLLSHRRVTLIVDDVEEFWAVRDRGNVVKIKPYTYFKKGVDLPTDYDDQDLERVWSMLKNVHTKFFDKKNQNYAASKDVTQLLRKITSN